ncbi:hypothetical protein QTN25_007003 [Entamoeba marina]
MIYLLVFILISSVLANKVNHDQKITLDLLQGPNILFTDSSKQLLITHNFSRPSHIEVFQRNEGYLVTSQFNMTVEYWFSDNTNCAKCPYDCNFETNSCIEFRLKGFVFTFDTLVDMLLPTKSTFLFMGFAFIVIVSVAMVFTMSCRFVDCFTDIWCNKAKAERKKLQKQIKKNQENDNKHEHKIELADF